MAAGLRTSITPNGDHVICHPIEVCTSEIDRGLVYANQTRISPQETHVTPSLYPLLDQKQPIQAAVGDCTMISSVMGTRDVAFALAQHGCPDITALVDLASLNSRIVRYGGFGDVYRAQLRDGTQVAIKILRQPGHQDGVDSKTHKRVAREIYSWSKCKHQNVLPLLGMMQDGDCIVMLSPWVEHGTLLCYIRGHPGANRCNLAIHIAEGLSYMHNIGAVHGDVKGSNVLVSGNGVAMLTDFGNTVLQTYTLQFTTTSTLPGCSIRWAAPEILREQVFLSVEADVYALGMTILETMTANLPYSNVKTIAGVITCVVTGEIPQRPDEYLPSDTLYGDKIWSLLGACWYQKPGDRPSVANVRDRLQAIAYENSPPELSTGTPF